MSSILKRPPGLWLNLGAGTNRPRGFIHVDSVPLPGIDVVADLDSKWPWPDGEAAWVFASHVFEHVENPVLFMTEAWRVLCPGGELEILVPYYQHIHSFTDPTHRRHCTELTFDYWTGGTYLHSKFGAGFGSPPAVYELIRRELVCERANATPHELHIRLGKSE